MDKPPKAVILTHPVGKEDLLHKGLLDEGVAVVCDPMISTEMLELAQAERQRVFDSRRLIFTSKRGVEYFFDQVKPAEVLDKSFICIGRKTSKALEQYGIEAWWVSGGRTAADLVEELKEAYFKPGEKWTALLSELADDTLRDGLGELCDYSRINVYTTHIASKRNMVTLELLQQQMETIVVCTSPSCFNGFMNVYGDVLQDKAKFASIGPVTTNSMKKRGVQPALEAKFSSYEALWHTIKTTINPH